MKYITLLLIVLPLLSFSQNKNNFSPKEDEMISMKQAYSSDNRYFARGAKKPYTGYLFAKYDNGELESVQQFVDGVGQGVWIQYDPDGRVNQQGTYRNNRVEGPVTFYYEDGSIK